MNTEPSACDGNKLLKIWPDNQDPHRSSLLPHELGDVLAEPGPSVLGHSPFVANLPQDGQHGGVRVGVALDDAAGGRAVIAVGHRLSCFSLAAVVMLAMGV